jgi:predicted nucleotidyltransferase component of viral defense system
VIHFICYTNLVEISNAKTQARKCLILYNITNQIITFKKHVSINNLIIAKMFKEEMNSPLKLKKERKSTKKRPNIFGNSIFKFFNYKRIFQKRWYATKIFFGIYRVFNC